jgi:hypothetical protein
METSGQLQVLALYSKVKNPQYLFKPGLVDSRAEKDFLENRQISFPAGNHIIMPHSACNLATTVTMVT